MVFDIKKIFIVGFASYISIKPKMGKEAHSRLSNLYLTSASLAN